MNTTARIEIYEKGSGDDDRSSRYSVSQELREAGVETPDFRLYRRIVRVANPSDETRAVQIAVCADTAFAQWCLDDLDDWVRLQAPSGLADASGSSPNGCRRTPGAQCEAHAQTRWSKYRSDPVSARGHFNNQCTAFIVAFRLYALDRLGDPAK